MHPRLPLVVLLAVLAAGCQSKNTPAPPSGGGGNQGDTITGRERIGWSQLADSTAELATYSYAIYVDGARFVIAGVSCATTADTAGYACSGALPTMTAGTHSLELATFTIDSGTVFESGRSAAITVTVQSATAPADASAASTWASGPAGVTADGTALVLERVADGLVDPVDLAVAPDGRVVAAERGGRVLLIDRDTHTATPTAVDVEGGVLLGVALDSQFARTRFLYALYASASSEGSTLRLARYRELRGTLAERAIVVNDLGRAAAPPSAAVRIAPDGRVLVATNGTGSEAAASFEGKLLRFESDATTPGEQGGTPVIASGLEHPAAIAWDRSRHTAWLIDRRSGAGLLTSVVLRPSERPRGGVTYRLPATGADSVSVYEGDVLAGFRNDLLLASREGRHILRMKLPGARSREFTTEALLQDQVGAILQLATAPDGGIYFTTVDAVGRLSAAR